MLVFFKDGRAKRCEFEELFAKNIKQKALIKRPDIFMEVRIQTGGYGIYWENIASFFDRELFAMGSDLPLRLDYFRKFITERLLNSREAADMLNCSRQYINELVGADKLIPVKASDKNTLFLKSDIEKLRWH